MIVSFKKSTAFGEITAPPSKSMAHRYLICGALSEESVIENVDLSADIKATLGCLEALGAEVEIKDNTVRVGSLLSSEKLKSNKLYCGESGSTLRFLIPLCLLKNHEITLKGTERLFQRDLSVFEGICASQGIKFETGTDSVTVKGLLSSGRYTVRGDISSQFITGLMLVLPLLSGESVIDITGKSESSSYLDLTLKALADFGVRISKIDENTMYIKNSQSYKNRTFAVEGDYSNSAFFDALNLIGGNVAVKGLDSQSVQGDRVYKEFYPLLLKGKPSLDISDCPDLAPVLMSLGCMLNGVELLGTHRLKIKESDRGRAMAEELSKFGCKVDVEEDRIEVFPCNIRKPVLPLSGHNDHRIVMAISLLCTVTGGKIYGAEAVEKSLPDFFGRLKKLGVKLEVENP